MARRPSVYTMIGVGEQHETSLGEDQYPRPRSVGVCHISERAQNCVCSQGKLGSTRPCPMGLY